MAKPVTITISHELGRDEATSRIRNGFDRVGDKLGFGVAMNQRWNDNRLDFDARVLGQGINGTVEVRETDVEIMVVLPALLAGMAETLKGKLQKESTLLLEKK